MTEIERAIAAMIGTPYVEGGRDLAVGVDCYGLARVVLAMYGVDLPSDPDALLQGEPVAAVLPAGSVVRSGDVVEFKPDQLEPDLRHLGVAISSTRFVHADRASGVCLERIDPWRRARRLVAIHRPRALAGGAS